MSMKDPSCEAGSNCGQVASLRAEEQTHVPGSSEHKPDWLNMLLQSQLDFAFLFVAIGRTAHAEGRLSDYRYARLRAVQIVREIDVQEKQLDEDARMRMQWAIDRLRVAIEDLVFLPDTLES